MIRHTNIQSKLYISKLNYHFLIFISGVSPTFTTNVGDTPDTKAGSICNIGCIIKMGNNLENILDLGSRQGF